MVWHYLWNKAGCQPGLVAASLTDLQASLGFSDATARRHLKMLLSIGLFGGMDWPEAGILRVTLVDPIDALAGDPAPPPLRLLRGDPQQLLFSLDDAAGSPPVAELKSKMKSESTPVANLISELKSEVQSPPPGGDAPQGELGGAPRAGARGRSLSCLSLSSTTTAEAVEIYEAARGHLGFGEGETLPANVRDLLIRAAYLAASELGRGWLLEACSTTRRAAPRKLHAYLFSVLKNTAHEAMHGTEPETSEEQNRARSELKAALRSVAVPPAAELSTELKRLRMARAEAVT